MLNKLSESESKDVVKLVIYHSMTNFDRTF